MYQGGRGRHGQPTRSYASGPSQGRGADRPVEAEQSRAPFSFPGGRGGGHRGQHGGHLGSRVGTGRSEPENGRSGNLVCSVDLGTHRCGWRTGSELALKLHRADRHLILPPGGQQELERIDPLLEEERREKARRAKRRGPDDEAAEQANSVIPGLNIQLDTPELVARWIAERRKRWPTAAVVEQKMLHSWDGPTRRSARRSDQRVQQATEAQSRGADAHSGGSASETAGSVSGASSDDDDEKVVEDRGQEVEVSSGSDMDETKDAVSSKVPPPSLQDRGSRPLCRFFQHGTCRNGDSCTHRHEIGTMAERQDGGKKRKRPRAPSPNPFEAPHLLRALLRNEIAQHVNCVAQVVRFLVRNHLLAGFEHKAGDAAEQARRRNLVVDVTMSADGVHADANSRTGNMASASTAEPLVEGALPVVGQTLYEPRSPTLKALQDLSLPPEPDEFALMDPLRAHDAKPMSHEQYRKVAQDAGIRALLVDEGQREELSRGMVRALTTLDDLPTYAHRASALELILGVSEQSALHAHQLGSTYVRSERQASGPGSRVIGEAELFRLGLRVGPQEIRKLRQMASRISAVIGGPAFEDDEAGVAGQGEPQPWWDEKTRHEMRIRQWHRDGEWRDKMRKLGIEVD